MSQRPSGYSRKLDENYQTIAWPVLALLMHLGRVGLAWDPCDRGDSKLLTTLRRQGVRAIGTSQDFFTITTAPAGVDIIICNPPYGPHRRGELAVRFIEHALDLKVLRVCMLLRNDFDSAISRQHLFRRNSMFAGKLVLLNRIKWFDGPSSPSDNHSWFLHRRDHRGPPVISYVSRHEVERQSGDQP